MPFWFWNDDLDAETIRAQIADFQRHGVHGFVIHPRVGLPRSLGWMSEALLDFYEVAVEEAAKRGMKVILYDEAMYPSGSSCGQVVQANPDFQCRGLAVQELPDDRPPELPEGATLVAVVNRTGGGRIAVIDRKIDSVIRGLHYVGEGPDEDTPPAADLLNPQAVAKFIELVYEGFARRLAEYFGRTIMGIFTDEPGLLGRCRESGLMPGTTGILAEVNRILGYDFTLHLAALWFDDEPDALRYRADYHRALLARLGETYYTPLHDWCEQHGLALMGHPEGPDHLASLRYFHVPGQDLVWRWVLPDQSTALEGPQSTQAKCSSSAMLHGGRRRNLNEYCGAYGHELTWDEMNWLSNWCIVRGVNFLIPHAFYYSMRGPRREERPPDVGPNAIWWTRYKEYADACRRLCWINTDSVHVCRVAILGHAFALPWRAAKVCYESQLDFNYVEERLLREEAVVDASGIRLGAMHYDVLVVDDPAMEEGMGRVMDRLAASGRLLAYSDGETDGGLRAGLSAWNLPEVSVEPATPSLRVRHVIKEGLHYFMLFNETAVGCNVRVRFHVSGDMAELNVSPGKFVPVDPRHALRFDPHELRVFVSEL